MENIQATSRGQELSFQPPLQHNAGVPDTLGLCSIHSMLAEKSEAAAPTTSDTGTATAQADATAQPALAAPIGWLAWIWSGVTAPFRWVGSKIYAAGAWCVSTLYWLVRGCPKAAAAPQSAPNTQNEEAEPKPAAPVPPVTPPRTPTSDLFAQLGTDKAEVLRKIGTSPDPTLTQLQTAFLASPKKFFDWLRSTHLYRAEIADALPPARATEYGAVLGICQKIDSPKIREGLRASLQTFATHCHRALQGLTIKDGQETNVDQAQKMLTEQVPAQSADACIPLWAQLRTLLFFLTPKKAGTGLDTLFATYREFILTQFPAVVGNAQFRNLFHNAGRLFTSDPVFATPEINQTLLKTILKHAGPEVCAQILEDLDVEKTDHSRAFVTQLQTRLKDDAFVNELAGVYSELLRRLPNLVPPPAS